MVGDNGNICEKHLERARECESCVNEVSDRVVREMAGLYAERDRLAALLADGIATLEAGGYTRDREAEALLDGRCEPWTWLQRARAALAERGEYRAVKVSPTPSTDELRDRVARSPKVDDEREGGER